MSEYFYLNENGEMIDLTEKIINLSDDELIFKYLTLAKEEKITSFIEQEIRKREITEEKINSCKVEIKNREKAELNSNAIKIEWKNLIPKREIAISQLLIYSNIFIFLLMVFSGVNYLSPNYKDLIDWKANFGEYTLDKEFYRVFTSNYIHIGIIHLLLNMYALLYISPIIEKQFGKKKLLIAYTISGIMGSIVSVFLNPELISAGASGAIFGLFGFFIVFLYLDKTNIENEKKQELIRVISIFIIYNIVSGFSTKGIDNAAHIAGLVSGGAVSVLYSYISIVLRDLKGYETSFIIIILFFAIGFSIYFYAPKEIINFRKTMTLIANNEKKANELFKSSFVETKDIKEFIKKLEKIKINISESKKLWEDNKEKADKIGKLPLKYEKKLKVIKEYINLQIKLHERLLKDYPINLFRINEDDEIKTIRKQLKEVKHKK